MTMHLAPAIAVLAREADATVDTPAVAEQFRNAIEILVGAQRQYETLGDALAPSRDVDNAFALLKAAADNDERGVKLRRADGHMDTYVVKLVGRGDNR